MVREAELDELRKAAKQVSDFSIENEVKKTFDPDGSLEKQFAEHNQAIMDATRDMDISKDISGATPAATPIADPGPSAAPAEPGPAESADAAAAKTETKP